MDLCGNDAAAGTPPHQKSRPPPGDHVAPPAPWRRLARLAVVKLREREQLAPHRPGRRDLLAVGADDERDCQRRIAVLQHQNLALADAAKRDAEEIADANVDGHPHAMNGTTKAESPMRMASTMDVE